MRNVRKALGVAPSYYRVDTCAGGVRAHTPYLYSTYEEDTTKPRRPISRE
ncbi:MAG: hypothetical protein U0521_08215 [Anaerolineae bacterium]